MCLSLCYSPFPEVAESVQEELDTYRAQEDEVKRLKSIMVRHCRVTSKVISESQGTCPAFIGGIINIVFPKDMLAAPQKDHSYPKLKFKKNISEVAD